MGIDPDPDDDIFLTTKPYRRWQHSPNNITIIQNSSNHSEWKCRLYGIDDFFFIPSKGNEPNWFWRTMQYILIGNKWSKK